MSRIAKLLLQLFQPLNESVGDVSENNQAGHGMLVQRRVQIGPQFISGSPQTFAEDFEELVFNRVHWTSQLVVISSAGLDQGSKCHQYRALLCMHYLAGTSQTLAPFERKDSSFEA